MAYPDPDDPLTAAVKTSRVFICNRHLHGYTFSLQFNDVNIPSALCKYSNWRLVLFSSYLGMFLCCINVNFANLGRNFLTSGTI